MTTTIDQEECDVTYKILLLGDSGVGKTSLIRALTGSKFSHNMLTTVGIDFVKVLFNVDGAKVRLQIWDTAGQERFRSITRFQYRSTKGLILMYDITNRQSYETLSYWMNSIEKDVDQNNKEPIPILVVGNKCDLEDARKVSTDEGKKVEEKNFLSGFWETSAANGQNVKECFQHLAQCVTDVYNPELMQMYKDSLEIDRIKGITSPTTTVTLRPHGGGGGSGAGGGSSPAGKHSKARNSTIKLFNNKKRQKKCDCS